MGYPKIDFLYLNEKDMIEAGVLDAAGCIETMRDTMELFGKRISYWEVPMQMSMACR